MITRAAVGGLPDTTMNNHIQAAESPFQSRVQQWMLECFGAEIAGDKQERNHRFFEEVVELVQACGMTASEAHQLVDYVFGRPVGERRQEAGGAMVTLAALCLAQGIDMREAGDTELARVWTKVEQIRAKQASRPKDSPLPGAAAPTYVAWDGVGIPPIDSMVFATVGLTEEPCRVAGHSVDVAMPGARHLHCIQIDLVGLHTGTRYQRLLADVRKPPSTRYYVGPIKPGMRFRWEPNLPHAACITTVTRVEERAGKDLAIYSIDDRFVNGPREVWNDESRFREAVVPL